jgi:type II secretory pathway predicted ATPase ExeA
MEITTLSMSEFEINDNKERFHIVVVGDGVIFNNTMKLTMDKNGYRVRILASPFLSE